MVTLTGQKRMLPKKYNIKEKKMLIANQWHLA
jgi:hypothetical protein